MKAIVRVSGGIGNQIFQIGFGDFLNRKFDFEVIYDISSYSSSNISSIKREFVGELLFPKGKYENKSIHDIEESYQFDGNTPKNRILGKAKISVKNFLYLIKDGLLVHTSEKFFWGWRIFGSHINHIFIGNLQNFDFLSEEFKSEVQRNLVRVAKPHAPVDFDDFIGVHLRRGDYSNDGSIHQVIEDVYYTQALSLLCALSEKHRILLFSDEKTSDLDFIGCREVIYVSHLTQDDLTQLLIMSRLRNLVIANSTFSAVAALIGENEKRVVMPTNWYRDGVKIDIPRLPTTWHRV